MSRPEDCPFIRFKQLPGEIRDMVWSAAWANSKPEVCTHLYTRPPTKGLIGFPPTQLIVDIDLTLMHTCRESRAFLLSKAGGVRFRYSRDARRNVPCRAFNPALDTFYLGGHNFQDAMRKNKYYQGSWFHPPSQDLPSLYDKFADCLQEVQTIALQPGILFPSYKSNTRARIFATFPQLRRISIVVNPFVDLERSWEGEAVVVAPKCRSRLVDAVGDTTWPKRQPRRHWLDVIRQEIELLQAPDRSIPLLVQFFEVYVGRRGRKQWRKYPRSGTYGDEVAGWRETNE